MILTIFYIMLNSEITDLVQSLITLVLTLIFCFWCSSLSRRISWLEPSGKSRRSRNDAETDISPVDKELKRMCDWLEEN